MARVGYARVSTTGQDLGVQLEKLAGCDKVYREKRSGIVDRRPELAAALEYVREGDVLAVTRLDRLARSTLHLCQVAAELQRKRVDLDVVDQRIDTSTSVGRLLFHVLAAIAEFELEIRAERQRDGMARAKSRGVRFGRKKTLQPAAVGELARLRGEGASIGELARHYRLAESTIYRYLRAAAG
jgi:DNA invertase Pin-like site-specific DNA recombinase